MPDWLPNFGKPSPQPFRLLFRRIRRFLVADFLFGLVVAVPAYRFKDIATFLDSQDTRDDGIQEGTVVAHGEHGPLVIGQ